MPADVALSIAIAPRHRRPALGIVIPPAQRTPEVIPAPEACDPSPRAPSCAVEVYSRHPLGMRHAAPVVAPVSPVTAADVLAAVERCRLACARFVADPRHPCAVRVIPVPDVPELVAGADDAARRARLERAGVVLRGIAELPALLAGEPAHVVARAKAAISRAGDLSSG